MVKFLLILLVVGAAAVSAQKNREGFRFIGSVKKQITTSSFGISSTSLEDKEYWMSVNAAGYAEAKRDCERNGDALLQIETRAELELVEQWLEDDDSTATLGWVGAKFNARTNKFTWENGKEIHDTLWATKEPKLLKANSRVVADVYGNYVELKTQANTKASRYICEGN